MLIFVEVLHEFRMKLVWAFERDRCNEIAATEKYPLDLSDKKEKSLILLIIRDVWLKQSRFAFSQIYSIDRNSFDPPPSKCIDNKWNSDKWITVNFLVDRILPSFYLDLIIISTHIFVYESVLYGIIDLSLN